ncbi:unnamed protein product [Pleuronectes platessa]|uniref:Uncharacterized protein n=1 Tax=Pleuronectes platessa TaxID=8262 RepID=A0A9N7VNH8_PLEPL|nr:unnamed protein product [Pleuronectes platessa]
MDFHFILIRGDHACVLHFPDRSRFRTSICIERSSFIISRCNFISHSERPKEMGGCFSARGRKICFAKMECSRRKAGSSLLANSPTCRTIKCDSGDKSGAAWRRALSAIIIIIIIIIAWRWLALMQRAADRKRCPHPLQAAPSLTLTPSAPASTALLSLRQLFSRQRPRLLRRAAEPPPGLVIDSTALSSPARLERLAAAAQWTCGGELGEFIRA